ncbi:hypothetical protein IWX49DRAFT_631663 [Phyllosticta citricarpa]|uniref:Uncharacterized protein n=2 Tax=Phyllosticta TaxID=121621 RepID=A0ABR1M6P1_9PEZI
MVNHPQPHRPKEPTVLEYARFHGIAKDYLAEGPLQPDKLPRAPPFLRQELVDPPYAAKVEWPRDLQLQHERLEIDISGVRALNCACRAPLLPTEPEDSIEGKLHRVRGLKVDLPILHSDNEVDMKRFMRKKEKLLSSLNFPLEDVDDENDEGLTWPVKFQERLEQIHKRIELEKLQMARADLVYLQACLRDDFSKEDQGSLMDQVLKEAEDKVNKKRFPEPMTPPLLPLDPPLNPFPDPRSSSPTNQIEFLSSDNNSAAAEAQALEEQLMSQDTLFPPKQNYDPMLYDEPDAELLDIFSNMTCDTSRKKRKAADLKVEVPLTPLSTEKRPKTVAFADDLTQFIAARPASDGKDEAVMPSDFLHVDDKMEEEYDFDAFFRDEVAPIAEKAAQRTEQEQLSEIDTVHRVDVPLMDFSLPVAPWKAYGSTNLDSQREFLRQSVEKELSILLTCRTGTLDARLRWNPFTQQFSNTVVDEMITYDKDLATLMADVELEDVVKPEDLAWKPDGLRVLDSLEEDEEDLKCASFLPGDDIGALVRKRKMDMREPQEQTAGDPWTKQQHSSRPQSRPAGMEADAQERARKAPNFEQPTSTSMFGSIFSASTSLSSFMKVHSGIVTTPPKPNCSEPTERSLQPHQEPISPSFPANKSTKAPLIPLPEVLNPASFIISTDLSTHQRSLMNKIQYLYPCAVLIERCPLAISPSPLLMSDHPAKLPPQSEPLPAILLAPSTALLLPTFTALAQRPLPGAQPTSTNFFPLQLARVAQRCERVYVGVWRGASSSSCSSSSGANAPPLSSAEALAFAEISGHAARLESNIDIVLVPGGEGADDEEALARWIVQLMARFAQLQQQRPEQQRGAEQEGRGAGLKLLQDETLWEQVLRRAGMDAFAAQVVLDALKKGDEGDERSREADDAGLAAFVRMSQEERVRQFGAVMGGRRVLDRVGRVLDQGWVCVGEGLTRM